MSMTRITVSGLTLIASMGCDPRRGAPDAAVARDAPSLDALSLDAHEGPDSGRLDVGLGPDAPRDASATDAPMIPDAGGDALSPSPDAARSTDAGRDASATDAVGPDAGPAGSVIECAPVVGSSATAGLVFSSAFWPGFRFQLAAPARLRRVGLELTPDGAGTVTAHVVALSGPSDVPDDPGLTGSDVIVRADVAVPAAGRPIVVGADADLAVGAGWYALVFGTTSTGGTLPSGGGRGCVTTPASGYPFSIRRSDGMLILQGAEPHLFVELAP